MTAIEKVVSDQLEIKVGIPTSQKTSPNNIEEKQVSEVQTVAIVSVDREKVSQEKEETREPELNTKAKEAIVAKLNETMQGFENGIRFVMGKEGEDVVVEVYNKDSGDVIRRIPPEGILKSAKNISKLLGLLIDEVV